MQTDKKVWFITGAGRGMGVDIAQAALAAGHAVVATGRSPEAVADAIGEADDLLVVALDVTKLPSAETAVQAAFNRFEHIEVLVNNAGNFHAGFFEELTPEQIQQQLTSSLIGPMNFTRAVLPVMRKQRSGKVVTITSPLASSGRRSARPTPPRSSVSKGGWSRCGSRSSRSASEPPSSSRASSAPLCLRRSQQRTPSRRSTTTPSAPPRRARHGKR